MDITNDCASLTKSSDILPANTLSACEEFNHVFFGGSKTIYVFAKSDLADKTKVDLLTPK